MGYSSYCFPFSVPAQLSGSPGVAPCRRSLPAFGATMLMALTVGCSSDYREALGSGGDAQQAGASNTPAAGGAAAAGGRGGTGGSVDNGGAGDIARAGGGGMATPGRGGTGGREGTGGTAGSGGAARAAGGTTAVASHSGDNSSLGKGGGSGLGAADGGRAEHPDAAADGQRGSGGTSRSDGGNGPDTATGIRGPCDIYREANTPCVAAHSTVRALYGAYSGSLYQVRRASDKTTKDVPVLGPGGYVDISVQDAFCAGTTCTISIIYDQSPNKNDLGKSPKAVWLSNGGNEANAADGKITVGGHVAHGIYVTGYSSNVAYRNNSTKGLAKNDEPEAMYMVVDGKRYSDQCCFDYGNAETSGKDDGNGTMEALYFGNDITWGGKGEGKGPWVAADLENGVFKGDKGGWQSQDVVTPSAKSINASYVIGMLKGPSGNHFTLKAGNAQSGTLVTMWDGKRPSPGYSPKKLQGAIILGTGGDGSNGGTGTFFEGAITSGNPPDATDEAVQANVVAAGYGR